MNDRSSLNLIFFYEQPLVKVKSHLYYEDRDKVNEALKSLKSVPGSKIVFFKNGKPQGEAFTDIHHGAYYPALSIYKNATISINFGPNFKYPNVEEDYKCRGVSSVANICEYVIYLIRVELDTLHTIDSQMYDRVEELIAEQLLADMMFFTENDGKLRLDTFSL